MKRKLTQPKSKEMAMDGAEMDRRVFLKRSVLGTAGLVAAVSGITLVDAHGEIIETRDVNGAFRIAGTDKFFDPTSFDTVGKPSITPDTDVVARSQGMWTFTYEVGKGGMANGGGLKIIHPTGYVLWWSMPQRKDPDQPGYIEAYTTAKDAEVEGKRWMPEWGSRGVHVKLVRGDLKAGDRIMVVWGRNKKTQAQHSALKNVPFRFTTDLDGDGVYQECKYNPTFDILPAAFDHLRVTARTDAQIGRPHRIHFACFDKWHNAVPAHTGDFVVTCSDLQAKGLEHIKLSRCDQGITAFEYSFATEGWHTVTVTTEDGAVAATSTPIRVAGELPEYKLYWGDIHGHTNISDGAGTTDEHYTYGRDAANLDICALTEHGSRVCSTSDIEWQMMKDAVRKYYKPGEFVTFLAYEYTAMRPPKEKLGHRCVYYLGDNEPIYRFMDPDYDIYEKVWKKLKKTEAMTLAHHSLRGRFRQNWDYFDPECEYLVEIYSYHGNSEYIGCPRQCERQSNEDVTGSSVVDALSRGYKLGFIGSGDGHQCQPGYAFTPTTTGGALAVYARELTREGIWEALKARRCYATSVRGIVVEFSMNGRPMGSDLKQPGTRNFKGLVKGTAPLAYVRVIKNGQVWKDIDCMGKELVEFTFQGRPSGSGTDFYYLRIGQTDKHLAWSSPIWVRA